MKSCLIKALQQDTVNEALLRSRVGLHQLLSGHITDPDSDHCGFNLIETTAITTCHIT